MKGMWYAVLLLATYMITLTSNYVVTTLCGKVQGKNTTLPLVEFLGIPYAKPPVGDLRFKKPEPLDCWKGILDATKKPPACMQYPSKPTLWVDHKTEKSEDCLYLNVYVPSFSPEQLTKNKTVIFWIHGGGFLYGSISMDIYDGKSLASASNSIVVTTNYRLGALGFFTTTLSEAPGNVAMYDVLEALKWVKNNIEYFGGNPNAITISGESAGAMMTSHLLVSPLSRGLYSHAIIQSGSANNLELPSINENMALCNKIAENVGCSDNVSSLISDSESVVKCLRGVDAMKLAVAGETILYETGGIAFFPQYGDEFLPEKPLEAVRKGDFQNSSILIGCTKDEGTFLLPLAWPNIFGHLGEKPFNVTKSFAKSLMSEMFKRLSGYEEIIDHYLAEIDENDYDSAREALSTALGDYVFYCPVKYMAEKFVDQGNDVYIYSFNHRSSNSPYAAWMKAAHFDEVEFVFGMPLQHPERYSEEEVAFSLRIMKLWSNFVHYGNPDPVEHRWPTFNRQNTFYRTLDLMGTAVGQGLHEDNCNFWRPYFGFT